MFSENEILLSGLGGAFLHGLGGILPSVTLSGTSNERHLRTFAAPAAKADTPISTRRLAPAATAI
jgi:hypothetical protein